jgi:uncharacterized OB-fold protein
MTSELPPRSVCRQCQQATFPVKRLCPSCGSADLHDEPLPPDGVVYSYTSIPEGDGAMRQLALVHTGGVRVLAPVPPGGPALNVGNAVRLEPRPGLPGFEAVAVATVAARP